MDSLYHDLITGDQTANHPHSVKAPVEQQELDGNIQADQVLKEGWIAERQLAIDWHEPSEQIEAIVDAEKIKQVLRNLLSNAVQFSPMGGTITIDLCVNVSIVLTTVRDQGPGIPADEREAVFDKFVQSSLTKTSAGGTGLGLAICREIIIIHQGCIWVENGLDKGAVFSFELPLHRQHEAG
jgi:signal transduction histidine kinase